MRRIHAPVWLGSVAKPTAGAFVGLFTLEAVARALLMTVIPLRANELLGDAQKVSLVYFCVAGIGLAASMAIPSLVHVIRRRWVVTLGCCLHLAAVGLYAVDTLATLVVGLACQMTALACLEIALNLYLMDHVPRQDMGRFEPMRMVFAGAMFIVGPWLGVAMAEHLGAHATYAVVAADAVLLGYFWFLRFTDNPSVTTDLKPPPSPLRFLPRFFAQPRLRLAWFLAMGRTSWWLMFFVYTPIYVTELGFDKQTGAAVVSLGTVAMLLTPLWGRLARRHGMRKLLLTGHAVTGVLTVTVTAMGLLELPWAVVGLLITAGFAASLIDGVGNVPFLRAVHPYERNEMTAVFVTFRHAANLVTPGAFAVVLGAFALPSVFAVGGAGFLVLGWFARYIHPRM